MRAKPAPIVRGRRLLMDSRSPGRRGRTTPLYSQTWHTAPRLRLEGRRTRHRRKDPRRREWLQTSNSLPRRWGQKDDRREGWDQERAPKDRGGGEGPGRREGAQPFDCPTASCFKTI